MRDLREFLTAVERAGELRRVKAPVDARLEITEICQRVVREEGPALLFENVEGADFPLAINLFGSRRRVELALGRPPAAIGESLVRYKRGDPHYEEVKRHLGGLRVGEHKSVPPWPDAK